MYIFDYYFVLVWKISQKLLEAWKEIEKNWKKKIKVEKKSIFFWKLLLFWEKTALNRGISVFSGVCKPHYTGDHTNRNRTNRGSPVPRIL